MQRLLTIGVVTGALLLVAACGSGSNNKTAPTPPPPPAPPATLAAAATATPAAAFQPPTPASNPVQRVNGTVASVSGSTVTLSPNGSFMLTAQTAITVTKRATAADIKTGNVVAITAKQQPDNSLLASLIRVFPTAPGGSAFFGQHPIDSGNLMTNATVTTVQSNGFSATFPGGSANVTFAPDVEIDTLALGTAADIKAGAMVSAGVMNGVATNVLVQ